jgi:hypothetical protein
MTDFCPFILMAAREILRASEREQNPSSAQSKIVFPATCQHQIVSFFSRILCVGQDADAPAKWLV